MDSGEGRTCFSFASEGVEITLESEAVGCVKLYERTSSVVSHLLVCCVVCVCIMKTVCEISLSLFGYVTHRFFVFAY